MTTDDPTCSIAEGAIFWTTAADMLFNNHPDVYRYGTHGMLGLLLINVETRYSFFFSIGRCVDADCSVSVKIDMDQIVSGPLVVCKIWLIVGQYMIDVGWSLLDRNHGNSTFEACAENTTLTDEGIRIISELPNILRQRVSELRKAGHTRESLTRLINMSKDSLKSMSYAMRHTYSEGMLDFIRETQITLRAAIALRDPPTDWAATEAKYLFDIE